MVTLDLFQVWSSLFLSGAGIGDDPGAQTDIKAGRLVLSKPPGPVHNLVLGSSNEYHEMCKISF